MKRRNALHALAAIPVAASLPAFAQVPTKIVFGYTAVTDFASVFVALEQGFFKKRGLEVEAKFIPINSTIPAAVQADSLQIGGPTPSVFLQSVDGGLDHVVVAGAGVTSKTITGFGLVAKAGSGIRTAQDCLARNPSESWAGNQWTASSMCSPTIATQHLARPPSKRNLSLPVELI